MSEGLAQFEIPPPGGVAWLDVPGSDSHAGRGVVRTGPLGLKITPLPQARVPYYFRGARLRGMRCIWSASTVSGAALYRPARPLTPPAVLGAMHLLARVDCAGSVFDAPVTGTRGVLRIIEAGADITEHFVTNAHLFTLNIPVMAVGLDQDALAEMTTQDYQLTVFQESLLRAAVALLRADPQDLSTPVSLVGLDRYLAALAGLLLRTAVHKVSGEVEQLEAVLLRADALIRDQAADPLLTPATVAAQLSISLRQLYRAFNGTDSPAARIRRRRLERAASLLATHAAPPIEQVASECGFVSAEYFSRAFRREFGLSPRAYRAAHRVEVGARR